MSDQGQGGGQPPQGGGFGQPPQGGFGQPSGGDASQGGFGQPPAGQPPQGGFGQPPAGQPPQGGGFGQPPAGQPPQGGGFGQQPQGGGFGQPPGGGFGQPAGGGFGQAPGAAPMAMDPQTIDAGKTWALLSYASFFIGFPIWIIPLAQKDNAFSLYHSKQAGAAYIIGAVLGIIVGIITMITCGFGAVLIPVVFLPMISAVHGLILSNNGEVREPAMVFGLGDKIFGSIQPKPPGQQQGGGL